MNCNLESKIIATTCIDELFYGEAFMFEEGVRTHRIPHMKIMTPPDCDSNLCWSVRLTDGFVLPLEKECAVVRLVQTFSLEFKIKG